MDLTLDDHEFELARRIKAMSYLAQRHPRSPGYLREAAANLVNLRRGRSKDRFRWILRMVCGIGLTRAYEVMRSRPVAETRAENAERQKKYRRRKHLARRLERRKARRSGIPSVTGKHHSTH
jgi:hypothetical protein